LEEKGSPVAALLALQVDDAEIVERIKLRGKSSGRPDDNDEATIRNRIFVYKNETTPVYDYYNLQHKSHSINGVGGVEDIFERLCELIDAATK